MNSQKLPISVCIIVKNEEIHIRNCINSVLPFASEIIVNDTGSTDSTLTLLNSYPEIIVFNSKWINDFSYSRNLCLEKATQPWILSIDADEVVTQNFSENLSLLLDQDFDGFLVTLLNFQNTNSLLSTIPHKLVRLFRNSPKIRFSGLIHEQISSSINDSRISDSTLLIEHFGYQENSDEKSERNLTLLKSALENSPKDYYLWFQLGVSHFGKGEFTSALSAFNNSLIYECSKLPNDILFTLYIKMAQSFVGLQNFNKAEELIQIALHLDVKNPFPYYIRVGIFMETKNYTKALENLLKLKSFNSGLWRISEYQIELDFGNIYYLTDKFTDAIESYTNALKLKDDSEIACYNLANCFFKLKMFSEAKEMYSWAIKYKPNFTSAKENLAMAEQQLQGV